MNPLKRIKLYKNLFTNVDNIICKWIEDEPSKVIHLSIEDIASETKTSKAAITRFCKKIGYNGFSEFKFELSRYIISGLLEDKNEKELNLIQSITSLYGGYLRQFNECINIKNIISLANDIKNANRVKIIGNNRSGLSALQMRYRMSKIGYDAEAITDMVLAATIEDIVKQGDLLILFSVYAKSKVYDSLIKNASNSGAKLVLVTMNRDTTYKKYCNYSFFLPCISKASTTSFLDDQALFFVFIEIVLSKLAI